MTTVVGPLTRVAASRCRPPVQHLQLHLAPAVEFVDLGCEREIEGPDRQRTAAGAPPDGFVRSLSVGDPHFHMLLVGADPLERTLMRQFTGAKLDRGIFLAGR